MYCKNCGKNLNQGEMFCSNCGTKIENGNNLVGGNTLNQNIQNPTISNVNNFNILVKKVVKQTMKKMIYSIICLLLLIVITGCAFSNEEKQKRENYFTQAKENAVNYVQNKYGFKPEVGTAKCTFVNSDSFASNCNEEIIVTVGYNDKWFKVLINGSYETIEGSDNYQYDQISKDIINLIRSDFGAPYKYQVYYGYEAEGIIETYYNGNNLSEIIEKNYVMSVVEYINRESLESLEYKLKSSKYSRYSELYIVNYKSLDSYKKTSTHTYNIKGSYMEEDFYENSDYLKDVITSGYGKTKYYNFN